MKYDLKNELRTDSVQKFEIPSHILAMLPSARLLLLYFEKINGLKTNNGHSEIGYTKNFQNTKFKKYF